MSFKMKSSTLITLALLAFSYATHGFDITNMLGQYPEFSTFNKFLTDTQIAQQINSRNTLTVLALDSGAMSSISGKSQDELKVVLNTHVILDYYEEKKLVAATGSKALITTLYQTTGLARSNQGFIKVALVGEGEVAFGSAVSGAPMDSKLVKTVTTQPYNISILQITKPIIFPGGGSGSNSPSPVPSQGGHAPAPSQGGKGPVPPQGGGKNPVPSQGGNAPAPSQGGKGPVPPQGGGTNPAPSQGATAPTPGQGAKAPAPASIPGQGANSPAPAQGKTPVPSPHDGKTPVPAGQGPLPSQGGKAPVPSAHDGMAPSPEQGAGSPAETPDAAAPISPSEAVPPSPGANAGSPGSSQAPAAGPADGAADAPAPAPPSSSSRTKIGLFGAVLGFSSLLVIF